MLNALWNFKHAQITSRCINEYNMKQSGECTQCCLHFLENFSETSSIIYQQHLFCHYILHSQLSVHVIYQRMMMYFFSWAFRLYTCTCNELTPQVYCRCLFGINLLNAENLNKAQQFSLLPIIITVHWKKTTKKTSIPT